jgi:hypothetical protein
VLKAVWKAAWLVCEGVVSMLDLKFGEAAASLIAEIQGITDLATLERVKVRIKPAQTLDDVRRIYAPVSDHN